MSPNFDIVLIEKPIPNGLHIDEIIAMCKYIDAEVYPIEIYAKEQECSAMGFISASAAESLDYEYEKSGLTDFVACILDNMDNEKDDCTYTFRGIRIYLTRNIL